jgi:cell division protein FtsX
MAGYKLKDVLWEYTEMKSTFDSIRNIFKWVSLVLLIVVLCVSFFSLVVTFQANIRSQAKEVAVMLGLGL